MRRSAIAARLASRAGIAVLAIALACLGGPGDGRAQPVVSALIIKPPAKCLDPRRPPDTLVPPPQIVSTFPAEGGRVRPGLLLLRFTFNVAMSCDGFFLSRPNLAKPCANVDPQVVVLSYDRLTLRMLCRVEGNTAYGVRLNIDPARGRHAAFTSLAGAPMRRDFDLSFSTTSDPDVTSLEAAEAEDLNAPDRPG